MRGADVTRPDRTTLAAFALLIVAAGGNAVAIRYTYVDDELDAFWSGASRFLAATVVFAVLARAMRVTMPRGRALLGAILYGALFFGGGFGLIYWGLLEAPAGLSQVLLACVPLLAFVLTIVHGQERFRWAGLAGAILAFGGVAVIFRDSVGGGVPLASMVAIVGGAVCWAEGTVIVKAFPPVPPAAMNAIGMATGTVVLVALSFLFGEEQPLPQTARTWGAQAYLVFVGTVGVFALFLFVLHRWTASAASYQFVLFPLVTVPLSAWLHDERITAMFALGACLVLLGVYLGALRQRAPAAAPALQDTPP